jgi:copper chaperone
MASTCELNEVTYIVPELGCQHCEDAVSNELLGLAGVEAVVVDIETSCVTVHGQGLDAVALRVSLKNLGYQAA